MIIDRVPEPSPQQPTPPPRLPQRLCGPDVTDPLIAVLADVRSTFAGWGPTRQREACDAITSVTQAVMAWDITDFFLPCTSWLCACPYHPPCGMPPSTGCDNETECGNSVQVRDKCFLAGTVNYALFGQICKLCCDMFGSLCEPTMLRLIRLWKLIPNPTQGFDDPGPPSAWARAGFHGFPGHIPTAANRSSCSPQCPVPYSGPPFRWVWEPHQTRSGCPAMPSAPCGSAPTP